MLFLGSVGARVCGYIFKYKFQPLFCFIVGQLKPSPARFVQKTSFTLKILSEKSCGCHEIFFFIMRFVCN